MNERKTPTHRARQSFNFLAMGQVAGTINSFSSDDEVRPPAMSEFSADSFATRTKRITNRRKSANR